MGSAVGGRYAEAAIVNREKALRQWPVSAMGRVWRGQGFQSSWRIEPGVNSIPCCRKACVIQNIFYNAVLVIHFHTEPT